MSEFLAQGYCHHHECVTAVSQYFTLTISDGDQEDEEEDLWLSITRPRELRCLPVPSLSAVLSP